MIEFNKKRIIVTFLMHLGDLTLTTPFLHVLRKAAPDAHIAYLVDDKLKDVVLHNPNIDEVITIDKKGKDNNLKALRSTADLISDRKFDVLINLHPNERCSFIGFLAKVPVKVGFSHFLFRPFLTKVTRLNRKMHAADMYIDVLAQLGVKDLTSNGLEIFPGTDDKKAANAFWQEQQVTANDRIVGFNIGSAVKTKRWAPERFAQVADALSAKGYKTVFFGGIMDEEMVKEATVLMSSKPIIATGRFTIGQLAAAMKRCCLIITNDSGPMHVAISQKVPIVAMYGPSSPALYGPYTKEATIVKAVPPCAGCVKGMKHECDDMQCMTRLTVEQVIEAAENWLKKIG
ncbi:MAG: glycosyltransferase family 9 protein [Acidaminococcaceae bacterium]